MPTLEEVARVARVSRATVSAVLRDAPYARVSPRTRSRIHEAANKLNYRPHHAAASLASRRTHVLGFAMSSEYAIAHPLFAHVLSGVLGEIAGSGYSISVHTTVASADSPPGKTYFLESARRAAADGFIVICSSVADDDLLVLHELRCPFVMIDRTLPGHGIPSICADFRLAGQRLVEHLAGLGYDPIVVIPEADFFPKSRWFKAGCTDAARRLGCSLLGLDLFLASNPSSPDDQRSVSEVLDPLGGKRFGIVSATSEWGQWALGECSLSGWTVPDRVGVATVYDLPVWARSHPELTAWDFPLVEMGKLAARILLRRIAGKKVPEETVITGRLIERGSTRRLAEGGER